MHSSMELSAPSSVTRPPLNPHPPAPCVSQRAQQLARRDRCSDEGQYEPLLMETGRRAVALSAAFFVSLQTQQVPAAELQLPSDVTTPAPAYAPSTMAFYCFGCYQLLRFVDNVRAHRRSRAALVILHASVCRCPPRYLFLRLDPHTLLADLVHDNLPLHPLPNHLADAAVAQLLIGGSAGESSLLLCEGWWEG
jgi:hypothetical protein